ncbi:MAG: hypothetical protein KGI50_03045 [Patescibacteria group bacterium]|nr:hypothetical protein [Patescibacteria group bacterium]MDE2438269.1 hypothetical protein [Patescibacteria group bacterium]
MNIKNVTEQKLALDLCKTRSTCRRARMAAVLSDKQGIFAWGWNHMLSTTKTAGSGMHAEHHAIRRANRNRLRGATLTVAGISSGNNKNPLLSKPCEHCLALAMKYGIKRIVYLTKDGTWAALILTYQEV